MNEAGRKQVAPYSALAAGYDVVMKYVDYEHWASYLFELLQRHCPGAETILELGCGTGSLALALQPLGKYHYTGTDRSEGMIRVARRKAHEAGLPVSFEVADFTSYQVDGRVDAVLLIYDGMNYLLEKDQVRSLLEVTHRALRPGGVFLFDQSTPVNSEVNEASFEDEDGVPGFEYVRRSSYDAERRLHTTTFEMEVAGRTYVEQHVQRAYTLAEVRSLIKETGFREEAAYEGFMHAPASDESERIQWVLQR